MTFKQLVKRIHDIKTEEDRNEVFGQIDRSYDMEKISWNDHELLYDLASMVRVTAERCRFE